MMWDSDPAPVLVGIDPGGYEGALEYAAAEARRRATGVHLVHVVRPSGWWVTEDDEVPTEQADLRDQGHRLLAEAAARLRELLADGGAADHVVSVELSQGSAVAVLAALSRGAEVVVLQHHGWSPRGETSSLSVTAGLAAVSHAPVVAVPDRWRARSSPGRVLVAVDDPLSDRVVLDAAVAEADRRGVELVAVQVVGADSPHPMTFPEGDVPLSVVHSSLAPADVLVDLADGYDLLIVGRHHRRHVVGAILGRTVRDLVRRVHVPVLVVDPLFDRDPSAVARPTPTATLPGSLTWP